MYICVRLFCSGSPYNNGVTIEINKYPSRGYNTFQPGSLKDFVGAIHIKVSSEASRR
jgi:hypothetical protein